MTEPHHFNGLLKFYEHHLREQVMPFWIDHCIDHEYGGLTNCVTDEGVVQSTDKWLWSQGRALWVFSALFNDFDGDDRWLEIAHPIARLLIEYGRCPDGRWAFILHRDGSLAEGPRSIYVDAFAMYGLTEYARATGDTRATELAVETFDNTSPRLYDHSQLQTHPHPIPPGMQSHGPSMIFALCYHELAELTGETRIADRALELAEIIMTQHVKPDHQLLYELVRPGGAIDDSDAGQTFVPGHAIESMWFMERIYRDRGCDDRINLAMDMIRWNLEKGWDAEYGGLFLARHARGGAAAWHQPDAKVWWPHTEALFALLRAYSLRRAEWALQWYRKIHDYAFDRYPNHEFGDWRQNLDRQGNTIPVVVKGLNVKDPFHLPRALIYGIHELRRLANKP